MRFRIGILGVRGDPDSAGVRVLDDHAGRQFELPEHGPCRVEVGQVVERELLARELLHPREEVTTDADLGVVGRPLMRILSVREVAVSLEGEDEPRREGLPVGEPGGNRGLVGSRVCERLGGQLAPRLHAQPSVQADLVEHRPVARRSHTPERRGRSSSPRPAASRGRRCRSSRPRPPPGRPSARPPARTDRGSRRRGRRARSRARRESLGRRRDRVGRGSPRGSGGGGSSRAPRAARARP